MNLNHHDVHEASAYFRLVHSDLIKKRNVGVFVRTLPGKETEICCVRRDNFRKIKKPTGKDWTPVLNEQEQLVILRRCVTLLGIEKNAQRKGAVPKDHGE